LASARAKDLNATQAAQQAALRAKFGNIAKAAAATLSAQIIDWSQQSTGIDDNQLSLLCDLVGEQIRGRLGDQRSSPSIPSWAILDRRT
jgi:hypothetical protein